MTKHNLYKKFILPTKILFIYLFIFSESLAIEKNNLKSITEGSENAKIQILVFESLTCPHCASFHTEVYPDLKKNFIDKGLVKIEYKSFPLDIAALNASKVAHCKNDGNPSILHYLFNNQNIWARGETIDQVNLNLETVLNQEDFGINFLKCINNKKIEDQLLEERIESERKFKIDSTPTIIINNKKFDKPLTYKNLKKAIEKLI